MYTILIYRDYNISATFNVSNLSPYLDDAYQDDLRTNLLQQGEDDGDPSQQFWINSSCKQLQVEVQDKVHTLLACIPGLEVVYKPDFVHLIC